MLTDQIREFLLRQRLGYVATVSPDGTPNLSPKGTVFVWDQNRLVFANIRSPKTISNLKGNPALEINTVDPILRKGYRFRGVGHILDRGDSMHQRILAFYRDLGIKSEILDIVLVTVTHVSRVTSPLYDLGISEEQISRAWRDRILPG